MGGFVMFILIKLTRKHYLRNFRSQRIVYAYKNRKQVAYVRLLRLFNVRVIIKHVYHEVRTKK